MLHFDYFDAIVTALFCCL